MIHTVLRVVRYGALAGICILAGWYAGRWYLGDSNVAQAPALAAAGTMPERLPHIALPDLDGQTRSVAEWAEGALLINFWATWCAPCRREMPMLERTWQDRGPESLQIVGIAVDRADAVGPYVEKTGVSYPILIGQSAAMEAAEAFGPDFAGLPYTVFAANGNVIGTYAGELHADQLATWLDLLQNTADGTLPVAEARRQFAQ